MVSLSCNGCHRSRQSACCVWKLKEYLYGENVGQKVNSRLLLGVRREGWGGLVCPFFSLFFLSVLCLFVRVCARARAVSLSGQDGCSSSQLLSACFTRHDRRPSLLARARRIRQLGVPRVEKNHVNRVYHCPLVFVRNIDRSAWMYTGTED